MVTETIFQYAAVSIIAVLLGLWIGNKIFQRIDADMLKKDCVWGDVCGWVVHAFMWITGRANFVFRCVVLKSALRKNFFLRPWLVACNEQAPQNDTNEELFACGEWKRMAN